MDVESEPLVLRARNGDVTAFELLYRETQQRVYSLCLRMTADEARARELTHEAFVRAWESLAAFRGQAGFASWMHRLAVNVVLQDARSTRRREQRVRLAGPDEVLDAPLPEGDGRDIDLERALAKLSEESRRVVVLHDIEGYRHDEIAGMLGVASGTVRARLHHARRQLREWMER